VSARCPEPHAVAVGVGRKPHEAISKLLLMFLDLLALRGECVTKARERID
jgi:hypothetical protein